MGWSSGRGKLQGRRLGLEERQSNWRVFCTLCSLLCVSCGASDSLLVRPALYSEAFPRYTPHFILHHIIYHTFRVNQRWSPVLMYTEYFPKYVSDFHAHSSEIVHDDISATLHSYLQRMPPTSIQQFPTLRLVTFTTSASQSSRSHDADQYSLPVYSHAIRSVVMHHRRS
jgi:hypothetical protein